MPYVLLFVHAGFSEEYIDEIKGTLVGSNLYLLVLTALITALQVRLCIHFDDMNNATFLQLPSARWACG